MTTIERGPIAFHCWVGGVPAASEWWERGEIKRNLRRGESTGLFFLMTQTQPVGESTRATTSSLASTTTVAPAPPYTGRTESAGVSSVGPAVTFTVRFFWTTNMGILRGASGMCLLLLCLLLRPLPPGRAQVLGDEFMSDEWVYCSQLQGVMGGALPNCFCAPTLKDTLKVNCNGVAFQQDFPALPPKQPITEFSWKGVKAQNIPPQASSYRIKQQTLTETYFILK